MSCCLASLTRTDESGLLRLYTDSRVRTFLGGPVPLAEARRRVQALFDQREPSCPAWAVRPAPGDSGVFLGIVTLDLHPDGHDVQISYLLLPEHQGCGHATQAVAAALQHASAVLGLTRVVAETQSGNARSIRLLERVGMRFERKVIRFGAEQCIYACKPLDQTQHGVPPGPLSRHDFLEF